MIKNIIYNKDCLIGLKDIPNDSVDLVVTSPPYYNARDYSQYDTVAAYLKQMHDIFQTVYIKLKTTITALSMLETLLHRWENQNGLLASYRWVRISLPCLRR